MALQPFDTFRLSEALTAEDLYGHGDVRTLPAGAVGTVIEVFDDGAAFEVEFMVREPQFDGGQLRDPGEYHHVTLEPHQMISA